METELFDVVGVGLDGIEKTKVIWVMRGLNKLNAEAAIKTAVCGLVTPDRFFTKSIPGKYNAGDYYR